MPPLETWDSCCCWDVEIWSLWSSSNDWAKRHCFQICKKCPNSADCWKRPMLVQNRVGPSILAVRTWTQQRSCRSNTTSKLAQNKQGPVNTNTSLSGLSFLKLRNNCSRKSWCLQFYHFFEWRLFCHDFVSFQKLQFKNYDIGLKTISSSRFFPNWVHHLGRQHL